MQFPGGSPFRSLSLPDSVRLIANYSFARARTLESIEFPEGITRISFRAFDGCFGLAAVRLTKRIERIDGYAFHDCYSVMRVQFRGNALVEIGDFNFAGMTAINELDLPNSLRGIGARIRPLD
jgi:hypothetical protein